LDATSPSGGQYCPRIYRAEARPETGIGASQRANEINNIRSGAPTALAGKVFIRLGARGGIGNLPLGIDGNVQAPRPHTHRRSMPGGGRESHPSLVTTTHGDGDIVRRLKHAAGHRTHSHKHPIQLRPAVVRHGHGPQRAIQTGVGSPAEW
jgi:hypothetical protein